MPPKALSLTGHDNPRRVLLPLGLAVCLSLFGDLTLYAVLPSQREVVGLSLASIGVMLGINRVVRLPGNPLIGARYDRVGRRRLFLLGMALGALSTLGYAVAFGFVPFLITRVIWGLAWTLINVGGMTMVQDIGTRANRGRLTGIYNAWMLTGFAVGPLLGGFLVDTVGFRTTMILYSLSTALGFLIALVALPETHPLVKTSPISRVRESPRAAPAGVVRRTQGVLKRNPRLLSVLLLTLIFQFVGEGVALSTLNLLLTERFGTQLALGTLTFGVASATGLLSAFRSLIAGGAGPLAGRFSDQRKERGIVLLSSLALGIAGFGLLSAARSWPTIIVATVISAVSAGAGMASLTAAIGDLAPSDRRGAAMGAYATAGDIGSAAGPFLAYTLILIILLAWVYLICALAFLCGIALLKHLYNRSYTP